ncbi:MAG: YraN family protein [Clostridiales bacterium]|nr:YraN family protein [Clostridiales bacterium]
MEDRKLIGNLGEELATGMLYAQGYEILERNFSCRLGEIDIVCASGNTLVFVEVKTRTSADLGRPAESVGSGKQHRIRRVAEYYMMTHGKRDVDVDFQVVEIIVNQIDRAF